jgi:hypothetical protein
MASRNRKQITASKSCELSNDLERSAIFLEGVKTHYSKGSAGRQFLNLAKDALFYASVRELDGFARFLEEMRQGITDKQLSKLLKTRKGAKPKV